MEIDYCYSVNQIKQKRRKGWNLGRNFETCMPQLTTQEENLSLL